MLGLLALLAAAVARFVDFSAPPAEDAAILMRYSKNLADGHGIVWNVGEPPVDGATDFLFMVVVAAVTKIGLALETATRSSILGAHVATVLLVYVAARRLHRVGKAAAFIAAGYVAVGPALVFTDTAFGAPFFGLFVAVAWVLAYLCRRDPNSWLVATLFSLACLLMGLARPEGALLALFMLVALVASVGVRRLRIVLMSFAAVFGGLGLLYFVWRWQYFGHPLPNPYYVKGGSSLYPESLRISVRRVAEFVLPFVPLYALALRSRAGFGEVVFSVFPIILFTSIWLLLSASTNVLGRFQYAVVVLVAVSWPALLAPIRESWGGRSRRFAERRLPRLVAAPLLAVIVLGYSLLHFGSVAVPHNSMLDAARVLHEYSDRDGLTVATTEAGLIPLYSGWRAVDTWGLNDSWIAHHGLVTEAYLERFKPEVIVMHAPFSPAARTPRRHLFLGPQWTRMTLRMRQYAEARGYVLSASFGRPDDSFNFYVRNGFRDRGEIACRLAALKFFDFGTRVPNLADPLPCVGRSS